MSAQLLEYTSPSDKVVRRVRAARSASAGASVAPHLDRARANAAWGASRSRACEMGRPAAASQVAPLALVPARVPAPVGLVWTSRGVAVMVALVALVAGVMLATVLAAFLAVSNDPLVALIGG